MRLPKVRRIRFLCSLALMLTVLLAGCGPWDQPQSALDPKGPIAQMQYDAFMVTLYVTGFLFVTVGGVLAYTVWRFRLRKGEDFKAFPKQSHGHPVVEVTLVLFASLMLVFVAVPTLKGIFLMDRIPEHLQDNVVEINVIGYQWWWEFEYPEHGIVTANEMVIPAGRAVYLRLRADDVIHSFWVPKLAGKKDLIPGQENTMWIKASEPGYFWGQCAEFCGESHAYMLFRVIALEEEEYEEWLAGYERGATLPLNEDIDPSHEKVEKLTQGQRSFQRHCLSCHRVGDQGGIVGPNLTRFGIRTTIGAGWLDNNYDNLVNWINHSEKIKPGNLMYYGTQGMDGLKEMDISQNDVEAISLYLLELK